MTVDEAKQRLRADIKRAMQTGAKEEARLLRALAGAIDNAEAVPLAAPDRYVGPSAFGDAGNEVPRLVLGEEDVAAIFARERDERLAAAQTFEDVGQAEAAARMRAEAGTIGRYL